MSYNRNVIKIPLEDLATVLQFPAKYLRNKANIRIGSIKSYFTSEMFELCMVKANPLDEQRLTLDDAVPNFKIEKNGKLIRDQRPRFVHVDLSLTGDFAGIAMGYLAGFVKFGSAIDSIVERQPGLTVPIIEFDFFGGINPRIFDKGEIIIRDIENIIYTCIQRGCYVGLWTADGYQSADMIQTARSRGILADRLSIDNTTTKIVIKEGAKITRVSTKNSAAAMDCLWRVVNERRARLVRNKRLLDEAPQQEKVYSNTTKQGKVVKVPGGSDDVIQCVAGVCYNIVENVAFASTALDDSEVDAYTEIILKKHRSEIRQFDKELGSEFSDLRKEDMQEQHIRELGSVYNDPFGDDFGDFYRY